MRWEKPMISDMAIKAAAAWIVDQWVADSFLECKRLDSATKIIREAIAKTEGKPGLHPGVAVPCKGGMAIVHIRTEGVYGYLPDDKSPSFIWPPELAEATRNRQA